MEDRMRIGIILVLLSFFSILSAQTYCAGDHINVSDLDKGIYILEIQAFARLMLLPYPCYRNSASWQRS